VSTVIPGSSTLEQLSSNVESANVHISESQLKKLEHFYENEVQNLNLPW